MRVFFLPVMKARIPVTLTVTETPNCSVKICEKPCAFLTRCGIVGIRRLVNVPLHCYSCCRELPVRRRTFPGGFRAKLCDGSTNLCPQMASGLVCERHRYRCKWHLLLRRGGSQLLFAPIHFYQSERGVAVAHCEKSAPKHQ